MREKTIADKMYLLSAKSLVVFNGGANPAIMAQLPPELLDEGEEASDALVDVVLVFALNRVELEKYLAPALARLGEKGSLWVAYLKQSAPKATDLDRENVEAYASALGATSVALISVDADWSGLRFKRL